MVLLDTTCVVLFKIVAFTSNNGLFTTNVMFMISLVVARKLLMLEVVISSMKLGESASTTVTIRVTFTGTLFAKSDDAEYSITYVPDTEVFIAVALE